MSSLPELVWKEPTVQDALIKYAAKFADVEPIILLYKLRPTSVVPSVVLVKKK